MRGPRGYAYGFILACLSLWPASCTPADPPSSTTAGSRAASGSPADLVLRGGAVYTVDAVRSWAQAVAVRDGKIIYVGSDEGVKDLIGSQTKLINLEGRMILPGFQDAHVHAIYGGWQALSCDLTKLQTKEQYVKAVADYAASHPDQPWIVGGGWSMTVFQPGGTADRRLLDEVVPDRPVFLFSIDGHAAWANSKALEIAGITKETPDPPDGRIDRDPKTGEPIGSLLRSGAVVAFGSDWSVSSANPLEEIEVAVTRMGPNGETQEPFLPEERIDLPSALAAFTINAAYVNSLEKETGSIEVGKLADLIVLDRNLFSIEPSEISEAKVVLTLLEGEPVHGDLSL